MSDYGHLVGHRFPGGTVTVESHLARLWADAVSAERLDEAHPSYIFALTLEGLGVTIEEILALAGLRQDGGSLAGELELEFISPLRVGATYDVDGLIIGVERKHGRRSGAFDLLRFQTTMTDTETGDLAVRNINTWVIPRAEG